MSSRLPFLVLIICGLILTACGPGSVPPAETEQPPTEAGSAVDATVEPDAVEDELDRAYGAQFSPDGATLARGYAVYLVDPHRLRHYRSGVGQVAE